MKSMYGKIALFILIAVILSACGTQAADTPVSGPAETEAPPAGDTAAPTETALPTEPVAATEASAATQPVAGGATVSFTNDVLPILESRCINCHGGQRTQEGLDLKTHASLMSGSENGPVVTPGDAANSQLVELIVSQKMPKRGPKLTPPQIQLIMEWVNQGALDN